MSISTSQSRRRFLGLAASGAAGVAAGGLQVGGNHGRLRSLAASLGLSMQPLHPGSPGRALAGEDGLFHDAPGMESALAPGELAAAGIISEARSVAAPARPGARVGP